MLVFLAAGLYGAPFGSIGIATGQPRFVFFAARRSAPIFMMFVFAGAGVLCRAFGQRQARGCSGQKATPEQSARGFTAELFCSDGYGMPGTHMGAGVHAAPIRILA